MESEEKSMLGTILIIAHYTGWDLATIRELDDTEAGWAIEIIEEIQQKENRKFFAVADYILAYQSDPTKTGTDGKIESDRDAKIKLREKANNLRASFTGEIVEENKSFASIEAITRGEMQIEEAMSTSEFVKMEEETE
jgi:hypothetical protein